MYNHAPEGYVCPFCTVASGQDDDRVATKQSDVIYRDEHVTAFIATAWWPNNAGHVLVIPNQHIENIYDLTPDIAVHVHETARQVAIAFKHVYGCDGTSTRQHNEPAGNQDVFHYHLHVFPRYTNDNLYVLTPQRRWTTVDERLPYAEMLRDYLRIT